MDEKKNLKESFKNMIITGSQNSAMLRGDCATNNFLFKENDVFLLTGK
jgi:hypothetical protein